MSTGSQLSCFIVGEGSLPVQCGEILLNRGHLICGIISPEPSVNGWAATKNIPHAKPSDDLSEFLRRWSFDYLFSVVNLTYYYRLLQDCIEVPRKGAINYHDALLPSYAGYYPTSWALMNREKIHGVTWHEMTNFIDAGNILKQQRVPVGDDDTAFTLNAKCYDAAIRSFGELIDDLSSNPKLGRKQDLKKRTFFPLYRSPVAGCLLRWDRRAQDIDAFVRALDFTPYANPLGVPKIVVGKNFFLVPKIDVLNSRSKVLPGTVITIDEKFIKVATADQDVAIPVLLNTDGESLAISDLASQRMLREGDHLGSVEDHVARQITVCYARARRHEGFWRERLSQLRPVRLPQAGRSPLNSGPVRRAELRIGLPKEAITLLENHRASWKTEEFLFAAFAAYVSRIVRERSFDIGFSDLRMRRRFAALQALFASHVPIRVNADGTQTFAEVFDALRRQIKRVGRRGTYARDVMARYPALGSTLKPKTGSVLPVVVQQADNLENYEASDGSEFTLVTAGNATECLWAYDAEVFNENIIMSMASQFATFLKGIAADPDRKTIADVPLLSEKERRQILIEFNSSVTEYPQDICFHQLFEAQVERTPDAIALVAGDRELSYRELNARANQLAHDLVELGVGPEIRVGIFMERSVEMVVAALGILKTGGAYVPLHPDYPRERVALMLADIEATILLTQQQLLPKVPGLDARLICLDADRQELAQEKRQNLPSTANADNLAYVTYTSGSTGKPNPVMVEHGSLVNYLCWVNRTLTNDRMQSLPMVSRLNFDGCLKQVFAPLLRGNQVRVLSEDVVLQPGALLEALGHGVKVGLNCVPSLWGAILEAVESGHAAIPVENFTSVLLGGERLSEDLVQRSLALAPHLEIWNLYGPTETTANASAGRIHADGVVTIGRPIANAQIHILDPSLNPVPIGIPGEIYIGGVGLSRGYLNRPELTAEKFIPNPFSAEPGRRLYQSGDIACYKPDGSIAFLGRTDDQVKIRGFRVELGEIEAALNNFPTVQEAVVVVREDVPGNKRLVGYVVNREPIQVADLRKYLKERLPDYMLPAAFVFLDSLPHTPNGKLDRNALPTHDQSRPELEKCFIAPRTPLEEILANIWAEVFNLNIIGIHDSFFDLGGHSLLAMQVISRARRQLQLELPLRVLFENPTVAELAKHIEQALKEVERVSTPSMLSVPRDKNLPLSFSQQRLWFFDQYEPNSSAYNIPSALRLRGVLNVSALEQSLNEIVKRHESLRTTFAVLEGQPVQVIALSPNHALTIVDLREIPSGDSEGRAQCICEDEARRPFDLSRGPLLRSVLIRMGEADHILLLAMHHIVSDGWSLEVLYGELSVLYRAFLEGQPSPVPELRVQYADFAMWQRQWFKEEQLDRQLSYWKKQLANNVTLQLPTDRPRPALQSYRGARQSLMLSNELTERLKALSRKKGTTLFMTLLAAFQILLHRVTGQEDIAVGSPIAGRNRFELENLIGFFLNTLVLRTNLSGQPTFNELLARVRITCLEAYAHQDVPFEKLLEELQPERDLSRFPFFQVYFNMLNFRESGSFELLGLTTEPIQLSAITAKFDLALYASDNQGALSFSLVYNPDLFEAATIVRLLGCYHTLLLAITGNPERPIWSLPLLTERERAQFSVRRNSVAPTNFFVEFKEADIEQSIPARFEQIVNLYGNRIAVKTTTDQWTYRELNAKANDIAQAILSSRANERGRIGLLFEHDAQMIAAIFGALKAGQTYVPLDPAYPPERLSYILEDSGTAVIATNGKNVALAKRLFNGRLHLINVDEFECQTLANNFSRPISPDILGYILYTSGSTGRPKGVMQNHRNVLHHIRNYSNRLHISSDDRLTLLSSYCFDAAVMDIFGALLNGAALHLMDFREEGPSALLDRLVKENITIYHSTPTVYRYLMNTVTGREDLSHVRLVVLGGEEVHKNDVDRFKEIFPPPAIFINGFGPTESTLALQYFIDHNREMAGNVVPIGYPVEDTEILLLNETGQDAEMFGEIAIRSEHVALGYWQRPEVTKTAFLTDYENASKRIYRTGDLGRLLPDGSIAFVGRKDGQVKIRGYRIEPGEIESVLSAHPGVRENIIVARQDVPDDERLVAYLVARTEPAPTPSELRSFVKLKLPEYMVPSAFVFLNSLPLAPNGKVDRNALPAPDQSRAELVPAYAAPRTLLEEVLVEIWADVLKLDKVGIHDNFFDLGGHSLSATQMASRARQILQAELSVRVLFEAPTVAELALRIR